MSTFIHLFPLFYSGADYLDLPVDAELRIPQGMSSACVDVETVNDNSLEEVETFMIVVTIQSGSAEVSTLVPGPSITVTLTDDDGMDVTINNV